MDKDPYSCFDSSQLNYDICDLCYLECSAVYMDIRVFVGSCGHARGITTLPYGLNLKKNTK